MVRGSWRISRAACWNGELEFILEFPDEGAKFTGDGDDAFAVSDAAGTEVAVSFAQALLHPP